MKDVSQSYAGDGNEAVKAAAAERLQEVFGSSVTPALIKEVLNSIEGCDELLERATAELCNRLAPASPPSVTSEASSSIQPAAPGNLSKLVRGSHSYC